MEGCRALWVGSHKESTLQVSFLFVCKRKLIVENRCTHLFGWTSKRKPPVENRGGFCSHSGKKFGSWPTRSIGSKISNHKPVWTFKLPLKDEPLSQNKLVEEKHLLIRGFLFQIWAAHADFLTGLGPLLFPRKPQDTP